MPATLTVPLSLKAVGDTGYFEGFASVYGNVDLGGDVILPGAFKEIVKSDTGKVTVLWQHKHESPIGVAEVSENAAGLRFAGNLVLDDPLARQAHAHMKAGSVRGMSIGYEVLPGGSRYRKGDNARELTALKLWEISVVTFGMNPEALIDRVKSRPETINDFERALRDLGFSRKQATAIAMHGFKPAHLEEDTDTDWQAVKAALLTTTQALKGTK